MKIVSKHAAVLLLPVLSALAGCQDPRGDGWQEVKALRAQVATLEKELDECRNGPGRLLRAARMALEKGEYALAIREAQTLVTKHPRSAEVADAQAVMDQAGAALAAEEAGREAAALALARETEQRRAEALRKMASHRDDAQGVTYYHHRSAPAYLNARSALTPYVVVDRGGRVFLLMRNVHVARQSLGIESYRVTADGRTFDFQDRFQPGSDDVAGWEWAEGAVTAVQRDMLAAAAAATSAVIRYQGSAGTAERTIPPAEKTLILDVLTAYEALAAAGQETPAGAAD